MDYERIQNTVQNKEIDITDIPLKIAQMIRSDESLSREQKQDAIVLVRAWCDYAAEHEEIEHDPFLLRTALEEFAGTTFAPKNESSPVVLHEVDLSEAAFPEGNSIEEMFGSELARASVDERVILYGGVARAIAKAHLVAIGKCPEAFFLPELPISDVDLMVVAKEGVMVDEVVAEYGSDLSGTKVVTEAIPAIERQLEETDVTLNQVAVHDGVLYMSEGFVADTQSGTIRLSSKEKPLFGSDNIPLPNGESYILRSGFYRALAVLLRGRGSEIVVSKENLEAEKEHIGRYWLVLLFVKLLKMKDVARRDEAILQWHQVARDIGFTTTSSPAEFLKELQNKFPEYSAFKKNGTFDIEQQTRWLIGKLVSRGRDTVLGTSFQYAVPETYTPSNITLRPYEGDPDLTNFWQEVHTLQERA